MKHLFIGIDIGSSSCKIGLFDSAGTQLAVIRKTAESNKCDEASVGREYDPEIWWINIKSALKEIAGQCDVSLIGGIGLTGQIGTHIILKNDKLMLPAISWQDGRASEQAEWLKNNYPDTILDEALGMHLPPGAAWPIPRLLWLKKHHPSLVDDEFIMMQPKDFIAKKITGELKTDILSLRGLVNPQTGMIDSIIKDGILNISNLEKHLPEYTMKSTELIGRVSKAISNETGLPSGLPVFVGCGDFHASLVGTGIVNQDYGFNITGTSDHIGLLVPHCDTSSNDPRVGRYPSVVHGLDIIYGATSAGGGSVDWMLNTILNRPENTSIGAYFKSLTAGLSNSSGLVFLPYINGERAPIWNSDARGVFFGISAMHKIGHFVLAVLEGVAYSLYDNWSIVQDSAKSDRPVIVNGAAAEDSIWNQIKADLFGVPFITMESNEASCLGSAILAAVGSGDYSTIKDAENSMTHIKSEIKPDFGKRQYYLDMFEIYRNLYKESAPSFAKLSEIRRNAI